MGSVLLVGNPSLPLKGFDVAIKALASVNQLLPIQLTWVCQTQPTAATVPALLGSGLVVDLHISPSQVGSPLSIQGHIAVTFHRCHSQGCRVMRLEAIGNLANKPFTMEGRGEYYHKVDRI